MGTKVIVNSTSPNRVSINNQQRTTIRTVAVIPNVLSNRLSGLTDVDASDPNTGETLVFDETLNKYIVKTLPVVDGGEF